MRTSRKTFRAAASAILLIALAASVCAAKDKPTTGRLLTGKVLDRKDNAVENAVVYLTNLRSHAVKSYIVAADGAYHFPELSPNIDYEVYAQYKGQKSDTKTVSQFDDRKQVNIVLRVDTK